MTVKEWERAGNFRVVSPFLLGAVLLCTACSICVSYDTNALVVL
jgi:hypothetical protein